MVSYRSSRDLSDQWEGHLCSRGQLVKATPASDGNWLAIDIQGHGTKYLPLTHPRKPNIALFEPVPDDGSEKLQEEYTLQQKKLAKQQQQTKETSTTEKSNELPLLFRIWNLRARRQDQLPNADVLVRASLSLFLNIYMEPVSECMSMSVVCTSVR